MWRAGSLGTMTERKPPGVSWETWIDKQIREGVERGLFDDLPGTGKPLPDIDKPRDEDRWIKAKLQAEVHRLEQQRQHLQDFVSRLTSEKRVAEVLVTEQVRTAARGPLACDSTGKPAPL